MSIEAMNRWLECAERCESLDGKYSWADVIFTINQAIEQAPQSEARGLSQQKQEPVAWMFQHEETGRTICVDAQQLEWGFEKGNPRLKKVAPLYTTPPQRTWLGLTDVELSDLSASGLSLWGLWRAIEAKLKEKNA